MIYASKSHLRIALGSLVLVWAGLVGCAGLNTQNLGFSLLYEHAALQPFDVDLNRAWRIDSSGELFYAEENTSSVYPTYNPAFFAESSFPSTPTHTLSKADLVAIDRAVTAAGFFSLPRHVATDDQDGAVVRMTIWRGGRVHTVTLVNAEQSEVRALVEAINQRLPDALKLDTWPLW